MNVVAEQNPEKITLFYKDENNVESKLDIENTEEGSLAFAIAMDILFRLGGWKCTKMWVNDDAEFIGILIDVRCGDKVVTI